MAQIIVVTSGKGGVGKSSTCAMVGAALGRAGQRVLLLEMDSGLRGLDIMLGVEDQTVFDLSNVLLGHCEPIKAIAHSTSSENLHLISAPYDPAFVPDKEDLMRLTRGISHYYDFVLVDTPAGLGRNFDVCVKVADRALLVVTPDPICVRDGARVADILAERGLTDIRLIINKVGRKPPKGGRILPDLDVVIDTTRVQLIGVIPYEEQVTRAASMGSTLSKALLAAKAYENIAARLCGTQVELAME